MEEKAEHRFISGRPVSDMAAHYLGKLLLKLNLFGLRFVLHSPEEETLVSQQWGQGSDPLSSYF